MKSFIYFVIIFFILFSAYAAAEEVVVSTREDAVIKYSIITGAAIGMVLDVLYVFGPFTGFNCIPDSPIVPGIILSGSFMQILSASTFSYLLAETFIKWNIKPSLSVPVGALEGALLGGLSGGLTFALMFAIAAPARAITINPDFAMFGDTWYGFALQGFLGGFMYGIIPGAVIGGAGGLAISFSFK